MKMQKCPKSVLSAFTIEAEVQRASPPKEPGGNIFRKLWRQESGLSSITFVERPNYFFIEIFKSDSGFKWTILVYFFNPKASSLEIVWSKKVRFPSRLGHSLNQPLNSRLFSQCHFPIHIQLFHKIQK